MIVPQLRGEDIKSWARQLVSVLQLRLPEEIAAAKAPAGGVMLYEGTVAPSGWTIIDLAAIDIDYTPPTGFIWIQRA